MYRDLKGHYWWKGMRRDIAEFVARCQICQRVKAEHQRPGGLLQPLEIPVWKWENITMDFVVGLPKTKEGKDAIWVIVDRLTKSAHFLPIRFEASMDKLVELYVKEVVRLHGVPISIVSDRDPRFTSKFWKEFQKQMDTRLSLSSAYHPQTDGQSERTIQTLEDMLRACALEFKGSWDKYIPLTEFTYNNSHHSSINMAPYEALYGRKCRSPLYWDEIGEKYIVGPEMLQVMKEKVASIQAKLREAQSRQKSWADLKRRPLDFQKGDQVFLRVSPTKGVIRFGKRGKLNPRFIGPYKVIEKIGEVAYRLVLPARLAGVHDVFHVSQLRKYVPDPGHILEEEEELTIREDLSLLEIPIRILDRKEKVLRNKTIPYVKIQWSNHTPEEATWELEEPVKREYPQLFGEEEQSSFEDETS